MHVFNPDLKLNGGKGGGHRNTLLPILSPRGLTSSLAKDDDEPPLLF